MPEVFEYCSEERRMVETTTKKCRRCKEVKPLAEFNRQQRTPDGLNYYCRQCQSEWNRKWAAELSEEKREARKKYNQEWRDSHRDRLRAKQPRNQRKSNYGLDDTIYQQMLRDQNGRCAICGELETTELRGKVWSLSVDHDHVTGQIRGLLCRRCNSMLGHVQDNPSLLEKAIAYLLKHQPTDMVVPPNKGD
jgi:hypothetical protein